MAILNHSVAVGLHQSLHKGALQASQKDAPILVSFTERTWQLDPIDLFEHAQQLTTDRYFWSQPDEGFTFVGLGIAQAIDAVESSRFRQVGTLWRQLLHGAIVEGPRRLPGVGPLLFGGFAFDIERTASALWDGYPAGLMVLPQVLYTVRGGEAWLTCNVVVAPGADVEATENSIVRLCEDLLTLQAKSSKVAQVGLDVKQYDVRPDHEWKAEVARTAQDIANGKLDKAVLARPVRLEASAPFEAANTLRNLSKLYTGCTIFAIGREDRCFLGATPERLAEVRDGTLRTMSLAGSIRRGIDQEEDQTLGNWLINSSKDQHEHAVVVQALVEALTDLCNELDVAAAPTLLKLGNVQHLCTLVSGYLANDYSILDVVERLHPTPAVGGRPRTSAMALIREREDFDRGWYAGPVGWMDQYGEGEFVVAIRSAILHVDEAVLFAGCGIVADSDPEREYAESCLKLKPMLSALAGI